jgi:hypothetical protein
LLLTAIGCDVACASKQVINELDFETDETDGSAEWDLLRRCIAGHSPDTTDITPHAFQEGFKILVMKKESAANVQAYQKWWAEIRTGILQTPDLTIDRLMSKAEEFYNSRCDAWIKDLASKLGRVHEQRGAGAAYDGGIAGTVGAEVKFALFCTMGSRADDMVLRAFDQLDADKSGVIDAADFKTPEARRMGFNKDACKFLMEHIDANGDGSISMKEWRLMFFKKVTGTPLGMELLRTYVICCCSGESPAYFVSPVRLLERTIAGCKRHRSLPRWCW